MPECSKPSSPKSPFPCPGGCTRPRGTPVSTNLARQTFDRSRGKRVSAPEKRLCLGVMQPFRFFFALAISETVPGLRCLRQVRVRASETGLVSPPGFLPCHLPCLRACLDVPLRPCLFLCFFPYLCLCLCRVSCRRGVSETSLCASIRGAPVCHFWNFRVAFVRGILILYVSGTVTETAN